MSSLEWKQSLEVTILTKQCLAMLPFIVRSVFQGYRIKWQEFDVEETCQQIILLLIENDCHKLKTFDENKASLKTWLNHVVAHHVIHDNKHQRKTEELDTLSLAQLMIDPQQEESYLYQERRELLRNILRKLPRTQQTMITLTCEGCSNSEIAKQLNIKPASVRRIKHEAIKNLKLEMGKLGEQISCQTFLQIK